MLKNELEQKRPPLFLLGLIAACALSLTALSWQTPEHLHHVYTPLPDEGDLVEVDWGEVIIETKQPLDQVLDTRQKKRSNNIVASNDILVPMAKMEGESSKPKALTMLKGPRKEVKGLAVGGETGTVNIRKLSAEQLPYFRDCGSLKDPVERFQCTQLGIRRHIADRFKVPSQEKVEVIPEKVNVSFVIDEYGQVKDISSEEEIDEDLIKEIRRVLMASPEFVPATMGGRRISVRFEIPMSIQRL